MKQLPESILSLLEPALYAVRQGTSIEVKTLLTEVDAARRAVSSSIEALHYPSFEAGALESLREVLNTSMHRAALNSVVDGVRAAQRGLDVLRAAGRASVLGRKLPQKALATEIGMNEGNLSRLAKRLVELGALEVTREGPSSYLRPTTIGEAALDELLAGWRAAPPLADDARPKVQLTDPFRVQSKPSARFEYGQPANFVRTGAGAAGNGGDRLGPQLFEQFDTAKATR